MSDWDEADVDIECFRKPKCLQSVWVGRIWGGVAALAFALGFLWFFVFRRPQPPPEPEAAQEPIASAPVETSPPEAESEPPLELPSLDEGNDLYESWWRRFLPTLSLPAGS